MGISLSRSRRFIRDWTLQELIAPKSVEFFSRDEVIFCNKKILEQQISEITGIRVTVLQGAPLADFSVDERMRWAAKRNTTRKEDKAYRLWGIFGVYMPLIGGEGQNALSHIRAHIDKKTRSDDTITSAEEERLMDKLAYVSDAPNNSHENQ